MNITFSITRKRMFANILSVVVMLALGFPVAGSVYAQDEPPASPWRDEFNGTLAEGWNWLDENSDKWGFNDGFLHIYASPYEDGGRNMLLRTVSQGDFAIETRVLFEPTTDFQFAGLYIHQEDDTYLALGRAFCDTDACVGNGIYFDYVSGGEWIDSNFATQFDNPFDPTESYLRLERRGGMVRAFYSHEGITWTEIGTHWIPEDFQVNGVGLIATGDFIDKSDEDIPAYFDYFEMTEGWGFLPEGFHDGDQGDVPSSACNVNGWAADPDDRAADLAVEIGVDGIAFPDWVYADVYRQDLADAGVCVDGNCSFSKSLWGTISSYEPHSIVTYAQDIPSGDWVRLSNSPKELTCRTYDIYSFDPLTGATKQITNIRDADEYNPSWSPNGKKVAHDVVTGDGQSIYITDVKTSASTPLAGAENGGNDAVWSPNGKWITFDRAWTDTPHIYIVPAGGGIPALVRENAMSADWAPNGKRLVFRDYTDGSIRTVAVDGGDGEETTVAPLGWNPSWSPDGNWIAYDLDGDIWKVNVNIHGAALGEPIQVTSGPFEDGQPTWSADSTMIIYHSGFNGADYDLWMIPAAGGEPTWLTGAPSFGDYDPAYAKNSANVAYASFSPDVQAPRTWVAAYTYDAGTWNEGEHTYHFEATWNGGSETSNGVSFNVSGEAQPYDGYGLLRPGAVRAGADCAAIDAIRPDQLTRFLAGYVTDYPMTYSEALAYFDSLTANAVWDDGQSAELVRHEIIPFNSDAWFNFICTFTVDLILDANQPDWVNSGITVSAGQTFTIEAFGLMNPCSDTYPNGAEICIFYTPVGGEWAVPYENEFGIFPGQGLPFMALLGRIGDGEPFYIGEGGTFTATQSGRLWFTPNDNLRTDNQGVYSVLVWLEP